MVDLKCSGERIEKAEGKKGALSLGKIWVHLKRPKTAMWARR